MLLPYKQESTLSQRLPQQPALSYHWSLHSPISSQCQHTQYLLVLTHQRSLLHYLKIVRTIGAATGTKQMLSLLHCKSRGTALVLTVTVVWGAVPCPDQRGPITGYRLRYSNGTSIVNTTGEKSRQHLLTGLTPFTSYSVQVAAINAGGTGPYSKIN